MNISKLVTNLVLEILSWLAEEGRLKIKQRQKEGIYSAKMRKVKFGRPSLEIDDNFIKTYHRCKMAKLQQLRPWNLPDLRKPHFIIKLKYWKIRSRFKPEKISIKPPKVIINL